MVLAEVLVEMGSLKKKINQLSTCLDDMIGSNQELEDAVITMLLSLLDKYRSHLILVNKVNNDVTVSIGGSEVSLANAVIIANTIKKKINVLDSLIENKDVLFDVFSLISNRDKLLEEYTTIKNNLRMIEWRTEID
jgi:hypothetical protein